MIYQIEFKEGADFISIIKSAEGIGDFCFFNNVFFISCDKKMNTVTNKFKGLFNSISNIDKLNYKKINNLMAKKWCEKKMIEDEIKSFEYSEAGQKRLKTIMEYIDTIEENNKNGGVEDSNGKEKSNIKKDKVTK